MGTFSIKRGDTAPLFKATIRQVGAPLNLDGCSVRLRLYAGGITAPVVDALCTIQNAAMGTVQYNWQPADTGVARTLTGELIITYQDAVTVLTAPTSGGFRVIVTPRVGV